MAFFLFAPFIGVNKVNAQEAVQSDVPGEEIQTGLVIQLNITAEGNTCLIQDEETGIVYVAECAGLDVYVDDHVVYVKPKSTTKIIIRDIVRK